MKLAVFFPGIGYHCDKPLLYYAKKLTQQCRYEECISLSYSYDGGNIRGNQQKMQQAFEALYAKAEEKLADVDFGKYSEILFISKSVGTIIAHSGTIMGLLFPVDYGRIDDCKNEILRKLPQLSYVDTVETTNEGLTYIKR